MFGEVKHIHKGKILDQQNIEVFDSYSWSKIPMERYTMITAQCDGCGNLFQQKLYESIDTNMIGLEITK